MATISEDYVSFDIAKLLKEKGFDWECISYYVDDEPYDVKYSFCGETNSDWESRCCSAPTLQMAMKWLREVHNLVVNPVTTSAGTRAYGEWEADIYYRDSGIDATVNACGHIYGETYEEAVETAIKYCLEHLI